MEPSFIAFRDAVRSQFEKMQKHQLFRVAAPGDRLWETYLASFPPGTNPIFKTRGEHDCQCCRAFIRSVGNAVAILDGRIVTIWDVPHFGNFWDAVAHGMAKETRAHPIENVFLAETNSAGKEKSAVELVPGSAITTFNHFHAPIAKNHICKADAIAPKLSEIRMSHGVLLRSLLEISWDAIETVQDLISQNSLYRGEENRFAVDQFAKLHKSFQSLDDAGKTLKAWEEVQTLPSSVSRFKNTAIGTLLVDLSEGKDLEASVRSFETKVAPMNYKRPTAVVSKAMIEKAREKIAELGLNSALERRYAKIEDITVNNVLFVDRAARKKMNGSVFDEIASSVVPQIPKHLDRIEEIPIEAFIRNVLPKAERIELLLENKLANNCVSLIAPADPSAKGMFKWGNNFSWSYTGDMADSIKERVKKAGGSIVGDLRCSLSWFNYDDLDLHMREPNGYLIYFGNKHSFSPSNGKLDVDMNAGTGSTRSAVENIIYSNRNRMQSGTYLLQVNNFAKRESIDVGFEVEIEFDGEVTNVEFSQALPHGHTINVAEIKLENGKFEITRTLGQNGAGKVKNIWGLSSQHFHRTSAILLSPNHWDDRAVGNKHYFFMLDGCKNEGTARGFFNEFLAEDLNPHRKVLELVGSKMRTDESEHQLSGIGFSSTQRNAAFLKVGGSFERIVKVLF